MGTDREPTTGVPRWVWVSGIVVAVLALVIVAVLLIGGGHNPPSHGPSDGDGDPRMSTIHPTIHPS